MGVLVEICCGSVEDVVESERGGAQRAELCSALALGGLTPSAATISEAKRLSKLPLMVMIRPRSGGFCYSEVEIATMERDIEIAVGLGADGIVFGVLKPDGVVNAAGCRRLMGRANGLPTIFHRAFDVTPAPFEALEAIVDLGCTRLLTSGQKPSALEGADLIRLLLDRANGRIEVLVGGGVRRGNLAEIVALTGCNQVHMTAHHTNIDTSMSANREVAFSSPTPPPEDQVKVIDCGTVAAIVATALQLSL
jgi:copper homeostasis protein